MPVFGHNLYCTVWFSRLAEYIYINLITGAKLVKTESEWI